MNTARYGFLILRALFEIMRYERIVLIGHRSHFAAVAPATGFEKPCSEELKSAICDAILLATCFYWKPVLCLQRSVCTVRLFRKYGIEARLAIGYRPSPFFFACVGRGKRPRRVRLSAYQERLQMLFTA